MFNRWHKEVLTKGRTATGTVVDTSHVDYTILGRGFAETIELRLLIRVTFPDGTSTEFTSNVPLHDVQHVAGNHTIDCWPRLPELTHVGASVPVRYDRSDRGRILLDLPALLAPVVAESKRGAAKTEPDA